jgi:putative ABC transport system substrate-binding protein
MIERREFITLLGAAAAWPLAARAQQPAMPAIGFLGTSTASSPPAIGFHRGLGEAGFVEGRNIAVEYRFSEGRYDQLPALVAELVGRNVAVLFAAGGVQAALAAKSAPVPVVFANGSDPLRFGLVASLNRPGGNITGVSFFTATLEAKRLGLLSQLVPTAAGFGVIANPANANAESQRQDVEQGGRVLGRPVDIVDARDEREIETAFATLTQRGADGLLVGTREFMLANRDLIVRAGRAT